MDTIEYIVLIVAAILAVLYIIRTIVKLTKGEDPCMFCKSCDDRDENSCCATKGNNEQQEEAKEDNSPK